MSISSIAARSLIFIFILFITTKILGKKHISQLSLFEYISGITLGDIAGEVILGKDIDIIHGLTGVVIIAGVSYLTDVLSIKNRKFRALIEGQDTVFIQDGKILEDHLKKENYSIEDLSALLRDKGIFNVKDVEFAVLEPKGKLSVLLKKENQPLTGKDLKLFMPNEKEPQTVIMDGQVIFEALGKTGGNLEWLNSELEKRRTSLENVFLAQVDTYGELTLDLYNDHHTINTPSERQLLFASMKKVQAELELLALNTKNQTSQKDFSVCAEKLKEVLTEVEEYLG
ncbi:DUF421 domain-containing protein [Peribacillus sp. SCS-37]|uniref:DUF421 domain-containing protein n=1 Tax=Paraperibacillus esterisolvens TaxID=3115296 RepID=UPI003905D9E0